MTVGEKIRKRRQAKGITMQDAASKAGMSIATLGAIERGKVDNPHLSTLDRIARVLACKVADLID